MSCLFYTTAKPQLQKNIIPLTFEKEVNSLPIVSLFGEFKIIYSGINGNYDQGLNQHLCFFLPNLKNKYDNSLPFLATGGFPNKNTLKLKERKSPYSPHFTFIIGFIKVYSTGFNFSTEAFLCKKTFYKAQNEFNILKNTQIFASLPELLLNTELKWTTPAISMLYFPLKKCIELLDITGPNPNLLSINSVSQTAELLENETETTTPLNYLNITALFLLLATWLFILIYYFITKKGNKAIKLLKEKNREIVDQKEELAAMLNMVEKLNYKLDGQSQALNKSSLVAILNIDGKIESVNEVFSNTTGYKNRDLENVDFRNLLEYENRDKFDQEILPTLKNKKNWRGELCQFKKDESCFWVDSVFVPLKGENNSIQIYLVQFDITERINADLHLIEQNHKLEHMNQLKNKLFSIVSHDFRSPLKSLQGTLTLLHKGAVTTEELKDLSGGLLSKVENTATFLENILNWAKSQMQGIKLKPQIINISRITNELIKLIKPQADKKFIVVNNHVNEEINVMADLEMIKLVLRNLISNALKFSYDEGMVEIKAEVLNDTAVISVTDHGTGIEDDQLKNIFMLENYSTEGTANETGAGLGLILCKDFVEQNNGEIWVSSKVGQGSTFSFSLPIVENLSEPELIKNS